MTDILLEVCCGSADDVIEAWKAGADRVELNSNLFQGGLTPTLGTLEIVKEKTDIPVMTMIRPRAGGFCYTDIEFETAQRDARALLRGGSDGLVFGFLKPDGTVDEERTRVMVDIAGEKPSVFHRALDVTPDWKRALDTLIRLGVKRVLTSGQAPDVFFALETIKEMIEFAGDSIEILPGAGVTMRNAARIIAETGCRQLHIARHMRVSDTSTSSNREIFFGGALYPPEEYFEMTDRAYIASVCKQIK